MLSAVSQRDAYANLLLPSLLRERGIEGRDAALATELTYGTLRALQTYDTILGLCSDRPVEKLDPPVREVLRLGAHQLLATRVASHAAVATSVDLAREVAGPRPAGFVNAVLRRAGTRDLGEWLRIIAPDRAADPIGFLAATYGYPHWIVEAFRDALGEDPAGDLAETEEALAAGNTRPRTTLAAIPGLATVAELTSPETSPGELPSGEPSGAGRSAPGRSEDGLPAHGPSRPEPSVPAPSPAGRPAGEATRWSPFGVTLPGGDPAAIPAVAEGRAFVQDEASQLVALALAGAPLSEAPLPGGPPPGGSLSGGPLSAPPPADPPAGPQPEPPASSPADRAAGPGQVWLDLCAGPGGKAALLGGLGAGRGARLLASDTRPHRARLAQAHLKGQKQASVVAADGRAGAWRPGTFDRVLADVPCSGLGALRRRPEARWRKAPDDVTGLGVLQRDLLGAAIDAARPGGVVAYVTCSPHRAETRDVVRDVLSARDDATLLDAPAILAGVLRDRDREDVPTLRAPGGPAPGEPARGGPAPGGPAPGDRASSSPGPDGLYAQFWPHRHGTDAIFLALIRRDTPRTNCLRLMPGP